MPLPSEVHIDTFLTGILAGVKNDQYIADEVLPAVPSKKLSGKIAKMGDDHYRVDFAPRAAGRPGHQVDWHPTSIDFSIDEFRLEHPVDDTEVGQYDDPFDAFRDGTLVVEEQLNLKKETIVAGIVMTAANYATGHTDTNNKSWNVAATGTPVSDVATAIGTIISKKGVAPSYLYGVCSWPVFDWLRRNDQVKAHYINTVPGAATPAQLTKEQVAASLGLAGLLVGPSVQITSKKGAATTTYAYVWGGDDFAVIYRRPNPGIMLPNFGYQVYPSVPGVPGGGKVAVDKYRDEKITSDVIRARLLIDSIVADNQLGYLFTSVDNA